MAFSVIRTTGKSLTESWKTVLKSCLMTPVAGKTLEGKSFVLTGTLPNLTRSQAKALIEASGGKVGSAVSRNTSYLVAGEAAGSKLDAARKIGVEIIDESALMQLLEGKSPDPASVRPFQTALDLESALGRHACCFLSSDSVKAISGISDPYQ